MALIPRDVVDAVRERTDIVEVIGRAVRLEKRGNTWVGLCPFHQEKTPSFNVIPNKQLFYCFGCQAAGDVFRFLMQTESLSFVEAVTRLAGAAGITIEQRELSQEERDRYRQRATLYDLMEEAASWFEAQLWTGPEGQVAREYLARRAIADDLCRKARLGWAPGGWTRLFDHLQKKGIRTDLIIAGGLAKVRDGSSGAYDAFRERLMIPIRDDRSRVIAFGGRILQGDGPKYINSPETDLYHKGHVLYGLDMAGNAIRARGRVVLVEGYFDVLSMHQAGFQEAIATCGTALTVEHAHKLRALTRQVIVLTDADEAGARAAEKALPMLTNEGIQTWRLHLGEAKDPDELIRDKGPAAMESALKASEPLLHWVIRRKLAAYGYEASGKERMLDEISDLLGDLTPVQIAEIAGLARVQEEVIRQRIKKRARESTTPAAGPPGSSSLDEPSSPAAGWRPSREITHLVWLLVHRHGAVADLINRVDPQVLTGHGPVRGLIGRLAAGEQPARIQDDQSDETLRRMLAAVVARERLYNEDEAAAALVDIVVRLARPLHDATVARLQDQATQAGRERRMEDARTALLALQEEKRRWGLVETGLRNKNLDEALANLSLGRPAGWSG